MADDSDGPAGPAEGAKGAGTAPGVLARLRAAGLSPRKSLGQHFLHDPSLLAAIVDEAEIHSDEVVFEIGTGPGTLTRVLAERARRVGTVEIDPRLAEFARREVRGATNVEIFVTDVLGRGRQLHPNILAWLRQNQPFVWVSNLPYNIAATTILAVCEAELRWRTAVLTVQAEVAERLTASPGVAAYGPISVLARFWVVPSLGRSIPPGAFWPPPAVDSRVLHLRPLSEPLGSSDVYASYKSWTHRLFHTRRKQLAGRLRRIIGDSACSALFSERGWDPTIRPEGLHPEDYLFLARNFPAESH